MPDDFPGFDNWSTTDADHRFPFGEIEVRGGDERWAKVWVDFLLPPSQPTEKSVAIRYAGVEKSTQLWFALECTRKADGTPKCQLVLRARHFHWWPEHLETGPGPLQEIRPPMEDLGIAGGKEEKFVAHGQHCDGFEAWWYYWEGKIRCELVLRHYEQSVQQMLDERARAHREAERRVPQVIELPPWPVLPDEGEPKPEPEPPPEGSMAPVRRDGVLAKIIGFFKRLAWGLFG